jgi:hypothetical protein
LPTGLFTAISSTAPNGFTLSSPSVNAPIELTVTTGISADTEITIVLTGLIVAGSSYSRPKNLKVKTSKDANEVVIDIKDIPSTP